MSDALKSVLAERARQDAIWGEQNNDPFTYLTVLMEEVGEFAQAALHVRFGGSAAVKFRKEAVHVAAVALAIVECIDRGKWSWAGPDTSRMQEEIIRLRADREALALGVARDCADYQEAHPTLSRQDRYWKFQDEARRVLAERDK